MSIILRRLLSTHGRPIRAPIKDVASKKYKTPIEQLRDSQKNNEERCFYPFIQRLDIKTEGQSHTLSVKIDDVLRMIFMGIINKNLAAQYCHFLAELTRHGSEKDFLSERCFELSTYLLKNRNEIPQRDLNNLLCDVAKTSPRNCLSVCSRLEKFELFRGLNQTQTQDIFEACYKYNLWDTANHLMKNVEGDKVTEQLVESFTKGVIDGVNECNKLEDELEKKRSQRLILQHLVHVVQVCSQNKIHFLTKYRDEFIRSLKDLNLNIKVDPIIKRTGRCTVCKTHLPVHPSEATTKLNRLIHGVLRKGSEGGMFFFTTPQELSRFQEYLKSLKVTADSPIDIVIDGLNTAYKNSTGFNYFKQEIDANVTRTIKKHRSESLMQVLVNTIIRSNMLSDYKRILIIGKQHMLRWPGLQEFLQKYNVHFFAPTDSSEDDLFQLYAATLNPNTQLVSNDYFRDHMSRVGSDTDRKEMAEWLDTHQVWIQRDNLKALWPTPVAKFPSLNKVMKTMHLPIVDYSFINAGDPPLHVNNKALKWVCCVYDHIDTEADPL